MVCLRNRKIAGKRIGVREAVAKGWAYSTGYGRPLQGFLKESDVRLGYRGKDRSQVRRAIMCHEEAEAMREQNQRSSVASPTSDSQTRVCGRITRKAC